MRNECYHTTNFINEDNENKGYVKTFSNDPSNQMFQEIVQELGRIL